MTPDLEFIVFCDGEQTGHYVQGVGAIYAAHALKEAQPDADVVIVACTVEEAEMTEDDYAVRPFSASPAERAANVVPLMVARQHSVKVP